MITKSKLLNVLAAIGCLGCVGVYFLGNNLDTKVIPQAEVQTKINTALDKRGLQQHKVDVHSATIDLSGGNVAIEFEATGHITVLKKDVPITVRATTVGKLKYAGDGEFDFDIDALQVKDWSFKGVPVGDKIDNAIQRFVPGQRLKDIAFDKKEEYTPLVQEYANKKLLAMAKVYLRSRPVYTMPRDGLKWTAARVALQDFHVENNSIVLKISYWALLGWAAGMAALVLVCILGAIALPFLGFGVMVGI